jgi:hypothetical protein
VIRILTILVLLTGLLSAVEKETEVPMWVLVGILKQETKSTYLDYDHIKYVDKRDGKDGELGPFQMTHGAWLDVRKRGEKFSDLRTNTKYAEDCAIRYLLWLYNNSAKGSWAHAIQGYNEGPGKLDYTYYANVVAKAKKQGYEAGQD